MKIKIDHIAKIEGHASFVGDIINGDVKKARLDVDEGARLIESILLNRRYEEAPTITSRICGVCPVVHTLTSIRALEATLDIQPSAQTILLRKLLMAGQLINSHSAHLFLFSLADFFGIKNDLELIKKYPKLTKDALRLRDFGNKLIEIIGGRTIHPLTPKIGGFRKLPKIIDLQKLLKESENIFNSTIKLSKLFTQLKYPAFDHSAQYVSLSSPKEYAIYDGQIKIGDKTKKIENFIKEIKEFQMADSAIKSAKMPVLSGVEGPVLSGVERSETTYMVGALARINNNYKNLNPQARQLLKQAKLKMPCHNPFYNIFAQAVELTHCLEESQKLLKIIIKQELKDPSTSSGYKISDKIKPGKGFAIMEAPRGILYHYYETNNEGLLKNVNIITPTAQNLSRLEDDFIKFLPKIKNLPQKGQKDKIKMLIRAYDPCLTCATH